jgi:hypothetical protein
MIFSRSETNGIDIFTGETAHIKFEMVPAAGGKILSIYNKDLQKEFLWRNQGLGIQVHEPGADYDTNFLGGIDELIPNDMPEHVNSIDYPDHGELWTCALEVLTGKDWITVQGLLPLSGLQYKKTVRLDLEEPVIHLEYSIRNESDAERSFLWKLHAALAIEVGDQLMTDAKKAMVVDPAYSRFKDISEFNWPRIENTNASRVPEKNGTTDFFYLYDITKGEMGLVMGGGKYLFSYRYDKKIFPYQWYFASYGGFMNHYTAILEPCSGMPMSVREAMQKKQCSILKPGEELNSTVRIYAGENK